MRPGLIGVGVGIESTLRLLPNRLQLPDPDTDSDPDPEIIVF